MSLAIEVIAEPHLLGISMSGTGTFTYVCNMLTCFHVGHPPIFPHKSNIVTQTLCKTNSYLKFLFLIKFVYAQCEEKSVREV